MAVPVRPRRDSVQSMWSKRSLGFETDRISRARRLRANVADLFLANDISGSRATSIFNDAHAAGAAHVDDLARTPAGSSHAHRDLLRRLSKGVQWPDVYIAEVPVRCRHTNTTVNASLPMLLPHEIVATFIKHANEVRTTLFQKAGLDGQGQRTLRSSATEVGVDLEHTVALGFWLDGVCTKWDRSNSHEMLCLALPGLTGRGHQLRIPLCVVEKKYVAKHTTWDAILRIMVWSLERCALGLWPLSRHDGSAWHRTDKDRRKVHGQSMGGQALLVQVVGDWKMYKDIFRLPQHNEVRGLLLAVLGDPNYLQGHHVHSPLADRTPRPLGPRGTDAGTRH